MAAARYAYTGGADMWYQGYLDADTGKMLVAKPGISYSMVPVEAGISVPPNDGRWIEEEPPPPAPPVPAPAPEPAPAPVGGEE